MKIIVLLKMVPDVIEDLEVASDGKSLDAEFLRMILSERDSHALEEGLLLKERHGGSRCTRSGRCALHGLGPGSRPGGESLFARIALFPGSGRRPE